MKYAVIIEKFYENVQVYLFENLAEAKAFVKEERKTKISKRLKSLMKMIRL